VNRGQPIPAIPTWKLKHSREILEEKSRDTASFNRGFRMQAVSPHELLFPSFEKCFDRGVTADELCKRGLPAYIGVDLAGKTRKGNAIAVVGVEPVSQRRAMLEIRYGAWTSPQTAGVLAEICSRHNVQFIQVENNAYQEAIIDWIRKEKGEFPYWTKVEPFTTGSNKADPQYGLPAMEIEFKNKAWIIPYSEWEAHPTTCVCDWCHWSREFGMYPKYKSWDGVMATWFARDALNKWGFRGTPGRSSAGSFNVR
jgi:hypothetical protein